ncbi:Flavin-containing monooxygenase YUCCA4 [Termitomyces sp. T112]|nr:Flavin-containing monooxygenase YUCCA4 [Termitomyces sp. T112]
MEKSSTPTWVSRVPSLDKLGAVVPIELDPVLIAQEWFSSFSKCIGNTEETLKLLHPDALWRDLLALTWDIRTLEGSEKIRILLDKRNSPQMRALKLKEFIQLQRPYPDLIWILGTFEFDVHNGHCSGVFRLVPTSSGKWKAFTIFTNLEVLANFPPAIGQWRSRNVVSGLSWADNLLHEREIELQDPSVLIIGAGQSALSLAARLKYLNVPTLMIEKDPRIGDSWRRRYDALCLHFPVWNDHMPYLPFPPTWPVYTPSLKMAEWLESYATILDLPVWTSSIVESAMQLDNDKWSVRVRKQDGRLRVFVVNHLVFATGIGDGHPNIPDIHNSDLYTGVTLHSSHYKRADEYLGKKVLVIGSGNSGHDIASDLARKNTDVTMFQRSSTFVMNLDRQWKYLGGTLYNEGGPPLELADNLFHSVPHLLLVGGLAQRSTKAILEDYSDTLAKLNKVGFRTNSGIEEAGILLQIKERAGGHYFDTGGSQLIIDGKIKLKNDSPISAFYQNGVEFVNGSRVEADIIIYATGVGDVRETIRQICGDEVANTCPRLMGVNDEGEMNVYRQLHRTGLWFIGGSFQANRFYSHHLALQIKAMEENIPIERYI